MYEVGYSDSKAFREIFRKVTGLSPLAYRNKYNKSAMK
ncbi:helix-turn-helix domain-containing protein [Sphingobacterium sp. E70]|nr:helix-turn-helix domain-containing protein [Sphingobacterium sp. E70]ULT29168.1 helix-turn-helix domain-containing protein [Sphingobacterium sp. E70]